MQGSLPRAFYLHLIKGPHKLGAVMGKAVLMSLLLVCATGHSRSGCAGSQVAAAALLFAGLCLRGLQPAGPSHGHSLAGVQGTPKAAQCKQEISSPCLQVAPN